MLRLQHSDSHSTKFNVVAIANSVVTSVALVVVILGGDEMEAGGSRRGKEMTLLHLLSLSGLSWTCMVCNEVVSVWWFADGVHGDALPLRNRLRN